MIKYPLSPHANSNINEPPNIPIPPLLNIIKVWAFFRRTIKENHLDHHNKNYYFCKPNIPVINLILGSRNMFKALKIMSLQKLRLMARVVFTKYRQFLSVFNVFEWGRILKGAMDIQEEKYNAKLCSNYFSVTSSYQLLYFADKFQKTTVWPEIVGFMKFISEIQQLVRKRSQKNDQDVILHCISLPICLLHFSKFCPIQKQ